MPEGRIFAVTGMPVMHSASPKMQNAGFAKLGIDATYTRLAAESAKEALSIAKQIGISGMNVTAPFKEGMTKLLDRKDGRVRKLGAVNTVRIAEGMVSGFNTDVDGVAGALAANGVKIGGRKAVVLGAGGAAKAAVMALLGKGAKVTVANRTVSKARGIAKKFGCKACAIHGKEFASAMGAAAIVVSTLSTGERVVAPAQLRRGMIVLDANYSKETALSSDAKARGCRVISGREWLLAQGTAAFRILTGRKAPKKEMAQALAAGKTGGRRNIALIGFMGSGKSETAKEIAKLSGMEAIEIDDRVERKAGMSIRELFEKRGEAAFRRMERAGVVSAARGSGKVISCGGGAILDGRNVSALKKSCVVVWLWASPEECVRRVAGDDSRPLLNVKDKGSAAKKIIERRRMLYTSASDLIVGTENRSAKEVAKLVIDETGIALEG